MAVFDKFVETIYQYQADRLNAAAGHRVVLTVGDNARVLTTKPATQQQIEQIVKEIAPEDVTSRLEEEGSHEFSYQAPAGSVKVEVRNKEGSWKLQAVPLVSEGSVATPREPSTPVMEASDAVSSPVAPTVTSIPVEGSPAAPVDTSDAPVVERADGPVAAALSERVGSEASGPAIQKMNELLMTMVEQSCSDLHLSTGNPPLFRKDGEMVSLLETGPLSSDQAQELLFTITPPVKREEYEACHDTDFAYEVPGLARFRCNLFLDRLGIGGVFRFIPAKIPSAEELGLSKHVLDLCNLSKGLVLVTGPTGSGKSTTLAALIDYINRHRTAHIISIEDPIEFVHPNRNCLVNQREVGAHTDSFKKALRAALREDPDIVLVGEMRDLETIAIAIETAETGHLVFGTLHTTTAPSTVDRIIDQFPADRQSQIRTMLSESLKAVISQTLCKKVGGGRVAALELLFVNSAISNLIRESKTFQIPSIMQTGKSLGMTTLNGALIELVKKKLVDPQEAYLKSNGKTEMKGLLERQGCKVDAP